MTTRSPDEDTLHGRKDSPTVVVVDDDRLFLDTLCVNLEDEGLRAVPFDDGQAALDYLTAGGPASVVLLDWRMPGLDGRQVLHKMREAEIDVPAIFLTSLSDQLYEEAALAGGAVDFVEKSRSFSIILRRIELITKGAKPAPGTGRRNTQRSASLRSGPLELRDETRRAFWKGERVNLTLTEFEVLRLLVAKAGNDVSYREIYDAVRGEGFAAGQGEEGYRANVRSLVKRVRQKFKDVDRSFSRIENYPGFGYRWTDEQTERR